MQTPAGCVVATKTDAHSTDVRGATLPGRTDFRGGLPIQLFRVGVEGWVGVGSIGERSAPVVWRPCIAPNDFGGGAGSGTSLTTLDAVPVDTTPGARRLAALLLGVQAVVLGGFAVFYLYELAIGEGSDSVRVVMSALVIALGGVGLALVTRGWLGGRWWPRTPTIVWSALLLPVGWGLVQGTQTLVGWLVIAVALVTGLAAISAREPETEVEPGEPSA